VSAPGPASGHTAALHARARAELPVEDREDFEDACRGRLASAERLVLRNSDGRTVWDMEAYAFLQEGRAAPATVHPSLWRIARLNCLHGLFEVVPGIYQARGYDLSNMTFVEGATGVIVIDPLVSMECAQAALALYRSCRGPRPVSAVIYSHTHVDHWGGVKGVVSEHAVSAGELAVWAPEGFMEFATTENVLAGAAMRRRAEYMFAPALPRGPRGQVDAGIGKSTSTGTVTLIPPSHEVTETGQEARIDGVRFVFQLVPDSEAPVEMNFHLPDLRALCIPENATHCMHNLLTPRGAEVRDALRWSKYIGQAIEMFGADSEALFAQHAWPRWGRERITEFLVSHRDMYRYLHDQTLRLANRGFTPTEIAAELRMPPSLAGTWACRGLYGSTSFNARAVYQRYLGFFDGDPAHLDPLPRAEVARRYVELAGGLEELLAKARAAFERGDYRWVAEIASHAVFAEQESQAARELLAEAFEQLGYQAESAPWRNLYLVGAHELREGPPRRAPGASAAIRDVARALPLESVWDGLGTRLDGPRAREATIVTGWDFTDVEEQWTVRVENGALSTVEGRLDREAQATVTLTRDAFDALLLGERDAAELVSTGAISVQGDAARVGELFALLDPGDPSFAIVTP
jgi:alkyl sulfatase BDS1-like metallo-beta-lactamase superfamily hydrolase